MAMYRLQLRGLVALLLILLFIVGCRSDDISLVSPQPSASAIEDTTPVPRDPQVETTEQINAIPVPDERGLIAMLDNEFLQVKATEADRQAALDVAAAIEAQALAICATLKTPCAFRVELELYPDQTEFDRHIMNPDMRGYFALSGPPHRIQMVSPAKPGEVAIAYDDAVKIAVHEFTHLALDEIAPELPAWLDEGTAVYVGPHELYATVCDSAFPFELVPPFARLRDDYGEVTAPDLFAYAAVDFIVTSYGMDKLNDLLRRPNEFENILGVTTSSFEVEWYDFMRREYHNET